MERQATSTTQSYKLRTQHCCDNSAPTRNTKEQMEHARQNYKNATEMLRRHKTNRAHWVRLQDMTLVQSYLSLGPMAQAAFSERTTTARAPDTFFLWSYLSLEQPVQWRHSLTLVTNKRWHDKANGTKPRDSTVRTQHCCDKQRNNQNHKKDSHRKSTHGKITKS